MSKTYFGRQVRPEDSRAFDDPGRSPDRPLDQAAEPPAFLFVSQSKVIEVRRDDYERAADPAKGS